MPAHVKAALLGPSLTLPISRGRLALGTWQGIYLCEHRDRGGSRSLVATIWGDGLRFVVGDLALRAAVRHDGHLR